jgi:hypothetical protein
MQFLKILFTNPKSLFKKEEGEKFAGIEYYDGKDKKTLR